MIQLLLIIIWKLTLNQVYITEREVHFFVNGRFIVDGFLDNLVSRRHSESRKQGVSFLFPKKDLCGRALIGARQR